MILEVENNKMTNAGKLFLWLIVIYSLLPGLAKLLGMKFLFVLNVPIIVVLFFIGWENIKIKKFDFPFLIFFVLALLHSLFSLIIKPISITQLVTGFYIFTVPCLGYFIGKSISNVHTISKLLIVVGVVHGVIGFMLYPFFPYHIYLESIYNAINEVSMFGRMGSVSGSLNFGVVMILAFVALFHKKEKGLIDNLVLLLFVICIFFSLQRSAWMGVIITFLFVFLKQRSKFTYKVLISISLIVFVAVLSIYQFFNSNIDQAFFLDRFSQIGSSAVDERKDLWKNGMNNFYNNPLGYGIGTAGQVARVEEISNSKVLFVPDGDFFKILSELGVVFFTFFPFLIGLIGFVIITRANPENKQIAIINMIAVVLFQMIGSNVSEFYYVNFIFWFICGFFFKKIAINR